MKAFPDDHLWEAYDRAVASKDAEKISAAANDIMREHMPFFAYYANQTAFRHWSFSTREDYFAELLAVAVSRIPTYSRKMEHERGRAQFVTYVKPYLKPVRYKVEGNQTPVRLGHEMIRMASEARNFISAEEKAGRGVPSYEKVAEHVCRKSGRAVSVARVVRLLSLPKNVSLHVVSDSGTSDEMLYSEAEEAAQDAGVVVTDPADIVADKLEKEETVSRVREAVEVLGLDALEKAVLSFRLMAETPAAVEDLAVEFGVTEMEVKEVEADLTARLRKLLA